MLGSWEEGNEHSWTEPVALPPDDSTRQSSGEQTGFLKSSCFSALNLEAERRKSNCFLDKWENRALRFSLQWNGAFPWLGEGGASRCLSRCPGFHLASHTRPVFPPCWATPHLRKGQKKERELTDVALADQSHEMSGRRFFFLIVPDKGWKISGCVWYHFQLVCGPCLSKKAVLFGNVSWQRLANCTVDVCCVCFLCNSMAHHYIVCLFVCCGVRIKPKAPHIPDNCSAIELYPPVAPPF